MAKQDVNKKGINPAFVWIILLLQGLIIGWLIYNENKTTHYKLGYVEISKLYDGFNLTKQLDSEFKKIQSYRESQLDTLKLAIDEIELSVSKGNVSLKPDLEALKEKYAIMQEQFNTDNIAVQNQYMEQISTQINSLVKEYGEKNKYDMIIGATGDGNLMHAKEYLNVTEDVLQYMNQAVK